MPSQCLYDINWQIPPKNCSDKFHMVTFDSFNAMTFYGAYHQNRINKLCHIICVPLIWMTAISFTTYIPGIQVGWYLYMVYCVVYLSIDVLGLLLYLPVFHLITLAGMNLQRYFPFGFILSLHVISWLAQIYTHQFHEKRSPALLDNVVQALVMAPFFVWLEVLFSLNYKPELNKKLQVAIEKKISELNRK
eukprot:NODE_32_length_37098_cov_1.132760.p18 type:complete len:191 gc:universal NODE_32_length_37098_cov_1.132760:5198-4626(-)